jgi:hypothetical protein
MSIDAKGTPAEPDADGVHPADNIEVPHYHFNVLKIVTDAQREFEKRTGKVAKFFYAPEALLYLIDRSVKQTAEVIGQPIPQGAFVSNVYGMELMGATGTCVTVSAEPAHNAENTETDDKPHGFIVPGAVGQA